MQLQTWDNTLFRFTLYKVTSLALLLSLIPFCRFRFLLFKDFDFLFRSYDLGFVIYGLCGHVSFKFSQFYVVTYFVLGFQLFLLYEKELLAIVFAITYWRCEDLCSRPAQHLAKLRNYEKGRFKVWFKSGLLVSLVDRLNVDRQIN